MPNDLRSQAKCPLSELRYSNALYFISFHSSIVQHYCAHALLLLHFPVLLLFAELLHLLASSCYSAEERVIRLPLTPGHFKPWDLWCCWLSFFFTETEKWNRKMPLKDMLTKHTTAMLTHLLKLYHAFVSRKEWCKDTAMIFFDSVIQTYKGRAHILYHLWYKHNSLSRPDNMTSKLHSSPIVCGLEGQGHALSRRSQLLAICRRATLHEYSAASIAYISIVLKCEFSTLNVLVNILIIYSGYCVSLSELKKFCFSCVHFKFPSLSFTVCERKVHWL